MRQKPEAGERREEKWEERVRCEEEANRCRAARVRVRGRTVPEGSRAPSLPRSSAMYHLILTPSAPRFVSFTTVRAYFNGRVDRSRLAPLRRLFIVLLPSRASPSSREHRESPPSTYYVHRSERGRGRGRGATITIQEAHNRRTIGRSFGVGTEISRYLTL